MGREHILANKRMYLLVQGTSDLHSKNPQQVVMGEEQWWDLSSKLWVAEGRWVGRGQRRPHQGRRERLVAPQAQRVHKCDSENKAGTKPVELNQGDSALQGTLGDVWEHLWLSQLQALLALVGGSQGYCLSPCMPRTTPLQRMIRPQCP